MNTTVDIIYETPTGKIKTNRFSDVAAFVIQHEIDHLECVTLEDIGLEIESDFEEATQDERNEIINMYLDSLDRIWHTIFLISSLDIFILNLS